MTKATGVLRYLCDWKLVEKKTNKDGYNPAAFADTSEYQVPNVETFTDGNRLATRKIHTVLTARSLGSKVVRDHNLSSSTSPITLQVGRWQLQVFPSFPISSVPGGRSR
jgi:hypothetical protein